MARLKSMSWIFAAAAILLLAGCASTGGGGGSSAPPPPSDEEVIQGMVAAAMDALAAKDIDALVAAYSDDFSSDNGDKADTIAFLEGAADQGFLDGLEIDQSGVVISIDGETATAGPVALEGAFGAINLSFELEKRDGKWWVTSQLQEQ